jgi:ribonuclease BN (tRNA processing enzyme)
MSGLWVQNLGVRGSIPAPGSVYSAVGGHTSCVAIGPAGEKPCLLLDAGTGIQRATDLWGDEPFQGTIALTHLHWDHVWGVPFFAAADRPGAHTRVFVPLQRDGTDVMGAGERFDLLMAPPLFPIDRRGLNGTWEFFDLDEGRVEGDALGTPGLRVQAAEIPHKGGRTFGFRVEGGGVSVAYLPDHAPVVMGRGRGFGAVHDAAMALCEGVDLLIHGGQFLGSEEPLASLFGHATVDYALELSSEARAGVLALTHHSPRRSDEQVAAIECDLGGDALIAREGAGWRLAPGEPPAPI